MTITVLGRDDCPATAAVRAALGRAELDYAYEALPPADEACGYTSPTVLVGGGYGGPRQLVQPDPEHVVALLAREGIEGPRRPRRA